MLCDVKFLSSAGRPFLIVATKSDRLSSNKLHNIAQTLLGEFAGPRVIPYSSKTGLGKDELWQEIKTAIENHPVPAL